jgi:signal transduction histidine kinase
VEVFTDLTEAKRMEAELQRVHTLAALGEMSATVAHEIRNPLGGMAGFAALLERDLEEGDPRRRLAGKISEGIARLNRIVSSLLAYTRPLQLNPHPVDLVELVQGTASFFAVDPACTVAGITINCRHTSSDIVCNVDPEQFRQVILNLLQNATQAMPGGGVIDVEVGVSPTRDPPRAMLRVCDGGVGMSSEVRQKLFTPFFTTKEDGTGLGLVTCKKIVEAHGGAIRAESREPGGTCFTISLPR